ncbi:hypothetical protein IPL85_05465 [Candidatus Saccharibacteria bacterium]|nr:MAG: hypothetical protein IPL85_05465 [Candidatus Saccharibacteria bacterium]
MGLLDNVFKSIDDTLKAIEDGAIEKKLTEVVDTFEKHVETAPQALEKVAEAPKKALQVFDSKTEALQKTSESLRLQASKTIDIIQRKD